MTPAVIEALGIILRYIIAGLLMKLATFDLFKASDVAELVGPITTIVSASIGFACTVGYALWRSRAAAKIAAVAAMPGVTSIHADPAIADAQGPKVIATPPAAP